MSHRTIDPAGLKQWMDDGRDFVLLDVLPREAYEEGHLPGARSACIYEVNFLDQAAEHAPDKAGTVVVYCSSATSRASTDAAERLLRAGYGDVHEFEGGREAWHAAGYPFEGAYTPAPPTVSATPRDGTYTVDTEKSLVGWVGRNMGGSHDGTLRLSGGKITVEGGAPASATLTIDMRSIQVADLDGEMAELLTRHLESEDFFAVAEHPEATFTLEATSPIEGATPGAPNVTARGTLTMRGRTHDLAFPAIVAGREGELTLEAHFDIDRTRWGVNYGSGKLYDRLGMHLVNDHVTIQVRVAAR